MKHFVCFISLCSFFIASAQNKTVTGKVLEWGTGTPLANITVTEQATTNSTRWAV